MGNFTGVLRYMVHGYLIGVPWDAKVLSSKQWNKSMLFLVLVRRKLKGD